MAAHKLASRPRTSEVDRLNRAVAFLAHHMDLDAFLEGEPIVLDQEETRRAA